MTGHLVFGDCFTEKDNVMQLHNAAKHNCLKTVKGNYLSLAELCVVNTQMEDLFLFHQCETAERITTASKRK